MSASGPARGALCLVPNTLDHGHRDEASPPDLQQVLPLTVIQTAARLQHWIGENAKSTRAFLKRVNAVVPLSLALQSIDIRELPRPPKGRSDAPTPNSVDMDALLAPALQGHDVGLLSEAGLPAVADPGHGVVQAAHRLGIAVVPMSGPSSLMLALAASGFNGQSFAFVGYVPTGASERAERLKLLEQRARRERQTQLMIETPYRNMALLQACLEHLAPATRLSVSVGLTLAGGWTRSLTVAQWRAQRVELPNDVPAVFALYA